jgi:hypothetical protein
VVWLDDVDEGCAGSSKVECEFGSIGEGEKGHINKESQSFPMNENS